MALLLTLPLPQPGCSTSVRTRQPGLGAGGTRSTGHPSATHWGRQRINIYHTTRQSVPYTGCMRQTMALPVPSPPRVCTDVICWPAHKFFSPLQQQAMASRKPCLTCAQPVLSCPLHLHCLLCRQRRQHHPGDRHQPDRQPRHQSDGQVAARQSTTGQERPLQPVPLPHWPN